ncbi:hypothetical protein Dda_3895 [Drechslerella dactyloides]|uniref:Leucine rich repeat protein n=1 Tax=Drechslerella dactyloides TaxID=74499 RepID=A0AAD6IZL6_DREDA|nr:hypothetical protein Dda_3895 [Drechslerella dactyloides]
MLLQRFLPLHVHRYHNWYYIKPHNMGRLTYVNRKITGVKLAQSIQRDIQKRIPKVGEDKKLAAVQRDPAVEIDASGRQLGPEGIALVCDSLWELGRTKLSRVEEINLSGNDLTAACLRPLRRALSVCPELRDLDLSNNRIEITTPEDMKEWGYFLEGFANLKCLRRFDLSHNPLGDIAVEIMFRTYAFEKEINIPCDFQSVKKMDPFDESLDANGSVESFDFHPVGGHMNQNHPPIGHAINGVYMIEGQRKESVATISTQSTGPLSSSPASSMDPPHDLADIHGLRGISYIVLSDINATDLAAVWLSYIITAHPLPSELQPHLPPLKEGPFAATLRKYDALPNCRGIILTENPRVTHVGERALKEAESRRDENVAPFEALLRNGQGRRRSSAISDTLPEDGLHQRDSNRRNSVQDEGHGPQTAKNRRALLQEERYSLSRTRAKIQLNALREKGVQASLLWARVMRMVVVSRAILLDYSGPITIDGDEPTLQLKSSGRVSIDGNFKLTPEASPTVKGTLLKKMSEICLGPADIPKRTTASTEPPRKLPGGLPVEIWMEIIILAEDGDGLTTRSQRLNIFHWARSRTAISNGLEYLAESTETQARRVIAKVNGLAYEV